MSLTLMYLHSDYIVSYVTNHPIDWQNEYRELARRGGAGDTAGVTPTPAVGEFLHVLSQRQSLFTQQDYLIHCRKVWQDWWGGLSDAQEKGMIAKLYRNFYPSMIDSLHVWAMLSEVGWFDVCYLDAYEDAIGKTDLTFKSGDKVIKLALMGPTRQAREDRDYKLTHRNNGRGIEAVEAQLSLSRVRSPGNKRWFRLSDFAQINPTVAQMELAS
jgi:hypothetical protein